MSGCTYDAIVVGARCAGAPLAMLLSRAGWRVLLVDRATFPSDTLSTHVIHPPGIAALRRWGLLDKLTATGCPPIDTYRYHFGPLTITGHPRPVDGLGVGYAPRRTVLDALLAEAACVAGAEFWDAAVVEELLTDNGAVAGIRARRGDGPPLVARAPVVVGADGRNSFVAASVHAPAYCERPAQLVAYYAYWSGLPTGGRFESYPLPEHRRGWGVAGTHDGLTVVVAGWPVAEMAARRRDVEATYPATLDLVPGFADRLAGPVRETPLRGGVTPNFFRRPFGPGWALVGDAGYTRDPITAHGISDAFLDAERCARALAEWRAGGQAYSEALTGYQADRDRRAMPMYEFTTRLASLERPGPELEAVIRAAAGQPGGADLFASAAAGTAPLAELFAFAQASAGRPAMAGVTGH